MSVSSRKSVHQIIQEVNRAIDDSKVLDTKVIDIAKKALLEIDRVAVMTSSDQLEFIALASRISVLAQPNGFQEIASSLYRPVGQSYSLTLLNQEPKDSLARDFLVKANLTVDEALQIEGILSKYSKIRSEIVFQFCSFENKGMSIEDKVSFLKRIGEEKMKSLIESVKKRAARDGWGVSLHIQNYGIRDQKALVEIAKIAAAQDGGEVSLHILNYGIMDQNALIEIAKIAAAQGGEGVSYYIEEYEITDQNALVEIAEIAAFQSGEGVSENIQNYRITDQKILIEIAKIAASQSGYGVSCFIKEYEITDQNALIEIAKIAAAQSGEGVSCYIEEYEITDQEALLEIAKIAAIQSGLGLSENIKNYGITDRNALIEIAKIALYIDPLNVLPRLSNFEIHNSKLYKDLILYGLLCGFTFGGKEFIWFAGESSEFREFLVINDAATLEMATEDAEKQTKTLFSSFLQNYAKDLLPDDLWNELDRNSILKRVGSYRNPLIRGALALHLFEQGSNREFKESYGFFASDHSKKRGYKDRLMAHKILPSIVLAKWLTEAKRDGELSSTEEDIVSELSYFITKSREEFRNNFSPLTQAFLLISLDLDAAEGLISKTKLRLLSRVYNQEDYVKGLGLIRSLLARHETRLLNTISLENPIQELKEIFEEALLKDQYINLSGIESLADKYLDAFENTRTPFALEAYTTGLRILADDKVKETLNRFVRSVLEGSFEEERYRIDNNTHLQKIHEYDQEKGTFILKRWKGLSFEAPVTATSERLEEQAFSFEDFFRQKLEDGHGRKDGKEVLKYLSDFLKSDSEFRIDVLEDLTQRIETEKANILSELDPAEKARLSRLLKLDQAQKSCIELITNFDLSKSDQMAKLESALSLNLDIEFTSDLKGLFNTLKAPKKSSSLERVELCSRWEDLFLSGTEVVGSCQRIDGNPDLNKCLLAYCLDGKNSMLAVKGMDGKILARSMLRLLWDKNESKPVLFLDRLYPSVCPKERGEAIEMAAKECSRELGLELFTKEERMAFLRKKLESFGSSCPFEYADGSDGVMADGVYTIKEVRLITL